MTADIAMSVLNERIDKLKDRRCPKEYCYHEFPEERGKSY